MSRRPDPAAPSGGRPEAAAKPLKRSFRIAGHDTSISLEAAFWEALREAAAAREMPLARLVGEIDSQRGRTNLSSAVRVWLLRDLQAQRRSMAPGRP